LIEDQYSVILSNEENILGRWREYFKGLLNPITITPSDTQEAHLGYENIIIATKVFLAVTTLRLGMLQVAMKSDLKCPKP